MLAVERIPYAAIDMDVDAVVRGRDAGYNVFYGDTSNPEILTQMGLGPRKTRAVVVALNNAWSAKSTVRAIRQIAPNMKIFARARNRDESALLRDEGVTEALPETIESSFRLGFSVLERVGIAPAKIREMLIDLRANNYEKLS
jgi:voltage-gated potassium channel Kch